MKKWLALALVLAIAMFAMTACSGKKVEEKAQEAVETVEEKTEEAAETVEEKADEAVEAAEETAEDATEAASDTVEAVEETVTDAAETATETASDAVEAVEETVTDAAETATETASDAVEAVEETVTDAAETATETASDAVEAVEVAATDVVEAAEEVVTDAVEAVEETTDDVAEKAADAIDTATEGAETVAEEVQEALTDAEDAAEETVEDTAEEVTEEAADAVETTEEAVENAEEQAEEAMENAEEAAAETEENVEEAVEEAAEEATEKVGGTLKMATNANFPPYEYYDDETGAIVGIDAEIADAICKKLGYDGVEIIDVDFSAIINEVTSGKADFGMAGMTVTDERLQSVDFTTSYATGIQSVIVTEDSEITSVDDLFAEGANHKVGVQLGTTGDIYCTSDIEEKGLGTIERFNNGTDAVLALTSGKLDCVVIDNNPAKKFVEANEGLKILDTAYAEENYAICLAKDSELTEKINAALEELIADGTVQAVLDKYIVAE